jgi:murein DD-endopeptidase MepM/ murein hydrolase activator NlpD
MSCGGNGKIIAPGDPWVLLDDNYDSPTYKQPNECDEGYLARAGNAEKNMAGGPEEKNKIRNVSVPVGLDLSVNTTFEMTAGTDVIITRWEMTPSIPGLTFGVANGQLKGTVSLQGKYTITVTAFQANGSATDSKSYSVIAQKSNGDDSIKFIHPMPGSVITSRCTASVDGTRVWSDPKRGRPHKGIDLAYPGGKLGNIRAAASGQVIRADNRDANGYGNLVIIGHTNAAGKKMCLTVYGHLSSIGVKVGQRVAAGDFIGVEGNTGGSHGAHLHFEIRGADFCSGAGSNQNSAVYDPAAYITGQVVFNDKPGTPTNDPGVVAGDTASQVNSNVVGLTPNKVDNKCSGYIPEPGNPGPSPTPVAPFATNVVPSGKCQTDGFNFVMKYEVGPFFNQNDPVTIQGLCDTYANRKKCGYVEYSDRLGGITKFGIAHKYNPSVNMKTLNLEDATKLTMSKYWFPNKCDKFPYPMCVIHFDSVFALGPGNCSAFLKAGFGTTKASEAAEKASAMSPTELKLAASRYLNARQIAYAERAAKNEDARSQLNGWTNRTNALKAFIT